MRWLLVSCKVHVDRHTLLCEQIVLNFFLSIRDCRQYVLVRPQLDKARRAYHKVSRKEQAARERETHAQGNPDVAIDKQKKIQEERELAQQEAEKVSIIIILVSFSLVFKHF